MKSLVTGATGFLASELIRQLQAGGHQVVGTGRQDNLREAMARPGCEVVFLVAHPQDGITEKDFVEPALELLDSALVCVEQTPTVRVVVLTSSIVAAVSGHHHPDHYVYAETDWSNIDGMRERQQFYALSKTLVEQQFWKWSKEHKEVRCCSVLPSFIVGAISRASHVSSTAGAWLGCVKGNWFYVPNSCCAPIDVRDVARLHILLAQSNDKGRFIISPENVISQMQCVQFLIAAGAKHLKSLRLKKKPFRRKVELCNSQRARQLLGQLIAPEDSFRNMYESFESLLL